MASIADYLRQQRVEEDPQIENLLRNVSTYSRNRDILSALGRPDTSAPKRGLLSQTLNVLGAPGRLVQAGLLEAAGAELPGTRGMGTAEVLGAALRGDIDTSASQLPGLKVGKGAGIGERLAKGAAAFAVDVATDPLSYVTAPASISRKAAATQLGRFAKNTSFLDDVAAKSTKGRSLVDELFAESPLGKAAAKQAELGLPVEANTALDIVSRRSKEEIAADQLAERLTTTFFTKGRQAMVRELETITGSRNAALSVFKSLPEEVRGGVVLAGITGKPLQRKGGEYIRLTSGATFGAGKAGEAINKARLAATVAGNVGTRYFSGKGGNILADIKKAELLKMFGKADQVKPGTSRFLDYVAVRDELLKKGVTRAEYQGRLVNAVSRSAAARNVVPEAERGVFDSTFSQYFFAPAQKFDADVATQTERVAFEAAGVLRRDMNDLYNEAVAAGLEVGMAGTPEQFSPLMLTNEGRELFESVGVSGLSGRFYAPERGRDSFVRYIPDPEEAARLGYSDPTQPGVTYLNARAVNDELEQRALQAGKSVEEAKKARVFEEDPIKVMEKYGTYVTNAIANKRFLDGLALSGTIIRTVPKVESLLAEKETASALSGISALLPEAKQAAERQLARIDERIAQVTDPKKLGDLRREIDAVRTQLTDAANIARTRVSSLSQEVAAASAEVAEAAPRIAQIRSRLNQYTEGVQRSSQELADRQRAARNVRARLATANKNAVQTQSAEEVVAELAANSVGGAEQAYYQELLDQMRTVTAAAQGRAQTEAALQAQLRAELDEIVEFRKQSRQGMPQEVQDMVFRYEQAVTKRNRLVGELQQARAARDQAAGAARRVERTIGLEQVNNLNALIDNYVRAAGEFQAFKKSNPITKNMTEEQKAAIRAQLTVLDAKSKAAKKALDNVTNRTGGAEFTAVAKQYSEEVQKVAKELTDEQFQAMMVITNEQKLQDYINTVATSARDDVTAMQAMGDIWRTFVRLRDILPESAFDKLAAAQKSIAKSSDYGRLITSTTREKITPDAMAEALVAAGYKAINQTTATKDLFATGGVLDLMKNIYRAVDDTEGWRRAFNAYIDPILLAWKTSVTVGRGPGYTATNLIGGMFMNYLGNVSVADTKIATQAILKVRAIAKKIEKANPNLSFVEVSRLAEEATMTELNKTIINGRGLGDLLSEFMKLGGFESTQTAFVARTIAQAGSAADTRAFGGGTPIRPIYEQAAQSAPEQALRSTLDFMLTNRVQRGLNDAAQTSEMLLRFSAFVDGFRRTGNTMSAMDKVHLLHFDYQDLAGAEQWLRRLVPFYTWTRNNVPAQLRAMVMQPGKIQRVLYANEEFKNYFGAEGDESWLNQVLPEYLDVSDGFVSRFKFGDNNLGFFLKLPFEDVNKLFTLEGLVPLPRGRELANMLGPFTTPIEMASGVNLQTGAAFNPLGEEVPDYYRIFGPLASRGPEGETRVPGWLASALGDAVPQLKQIEGLAGAASNLPGVPDLGLSSGAQQEKGLATALSFFGLPALAGLGVSTVSPRTISGELRRRQKSQSAEIKKAAAELGVDVDWLRDRLDEGVPVEQIYREVQAGLGKPGAKKQVTRKRSASERYIDLLQNL